MYSTIINLKASILINGVQNYEVSVEEKKTSKGSTTFSSSGPIPQDTTQLFSLNHSTMINQFVWWSSSSFAIPLLFLSPKSRTLNFHFDFWTKAFERFKIENDVLECYITDDMIVPFSKETFLKAIGVSPNPEGYQVVEPTAEEF